MSKLMSNCESCTETIVLDHCTTVLCAHGSCNLKFLKIMLKYLRYLPISASPRASHPLNDFTGFWQIFSLNMVSSLMFLVPYILFL